MVGLMEAGQFLEKSLNGMSDELRRKVMVAMDEIGSNIVKYSKASEMSVLVEKVMNPEVVRLTISDDGLPWNPLQQAVPDLAAAPEQRQIGGLGIFLVKSLMDDVNYEFRDGRNVLHVRCH